jgi:predicted RNase H-like HicB family nuclease
MTLTATIEQAEDGSWTAVAVLGEHTIIGDGDTKDAAIADLRNGAAALFEYLKSEGKLPEVVGVEVAA